MQSERISPTAVPSLDEFVAMSSDERHAFNQAYALAVTPCGCPDDCNCHYPWRVNYCGCGAHDAR